MQAIHACRLNAFILRNIHIPQAKQMEALFHTLISRIHIQQPWLMMMMMMQKIVKTQFNVPPESA